LAVLAEALKGMGDRAENFSLISSEVLNNLSPLGDKLVNGTLAKLSVFKNKT
jgi:hypothetical protein